MEHPAFEKMASMALAPENLEKTIEYLSEKLSFLKKSDIVFICFAKDKPGSFAELMEKAVERRGAKSVLVEKDWRWMTLLRLAFSSRANVIVATPLVLLGLTKLARYKGTPLYIRKVVTAGYPCLEWMIEGIARGLDCDTWGCFSPRGHSVVAGFSCGKSLGVHLRDDVYGVRIVDEQGMEVPQGEMGDMILYPLEAPELCFPVGDRARLDTTPCVCGCESPRLMDITHGSATDPELASIGRDLMSWTSILDCRLRRSECGLEMEVVTFPGEKLPKMPSCARRMVRAWNPEKDEPFFYVPGVNKYY